MDNSNTSLMAEFIRYNNWANAEIIAACRNLSEDELAATAPGTFGSVRDTLEHIIGAEAHYARRLSGVYAEPPFNWEDKPDMDAVSAYAARVGEVMLDAVSRVQPTDMLHEQWEEGNVEYRAVARLIQIVNHGIEHRTNITTILEQHNIKPPTVDGWTYMQANTEHLNFKMEASNG